MVGMIPVYPNSINIRIQTSCKYDLTQHSIRESKILKIQNVWYIFITIEKQDEPIIRADNVLAVDLGCKNVAVTVNTVNTKPNFYGAAVRGIASYKIKSLKNAEFLQVNHELHKISKAIVEEAKRTNAVIVLGKLKGIRKNIKGGRRIRRLINNFPYYRLVQYIKYKAAWTSIRVLEISEVDTSNTCFNCRTKDKKARKTQGLFQCGNCSIRTNADYNAAMNILQRGVGILSTLGGFLTYPEPPMIIERNKMIMKEPQML
jgi:putative transposase